MPDSSDPHAGQPLRRLGPDPSVARVAVILVHGRGSSADDILTLAEAVGLDDVAWLAPQAAGHTWYPYSFLTPMAKNEPALTSALRTLERTVGDLERAGVAAGRIALAGFSQGACLTVEFAARRPCRYAAIAGLSGGLIGPPGTPRDYPGSLAGTPVFLGCSDVDAHIPLDRVQESAEVFRRMGAEVDARIYPGMGHTINADEVKVVRALLAAPAVPGPGAR